MKPLSATLAVLLFATVSLQAQLRAEWEIEGEFVYQLSTGTATFTNGMVIKHTNAVLSAQKGSLNDSTGEAIAEGRVRIQQDDQVWVGEHVRYNFRTRQIVSEQFRTGKSPTFAAGSGLHLNLSNQTYNATNALITADDVAEPDIKIRASRMRIISNQKIEAWNAVLYLGDVPVFYFPYYARNLGDRANNFNFVPGYRSKFGPYLLTDYTWFFDQHFDGKFRLDYRQKRGVGLGPDLNYHFGKWGDGTLRYYYTHDDAANTNFINSPVFENRQRVHFTYLGRPRTNVELRSVVRYQNDAGVIRDFFEGEYRHNPQPSTFIDVNTFSRNFSLDIYAQPRVNEFYETVERLPDIRLTGFRQQLGKSPLYYESESSAGYYRRLFAETNAVTSTMDFEAARVDTYHQILLPLTFFGWLNVTPRVGERLSYYSRATGPGATTDEAERAVFNTGVEVSLKASRVWPEMQSRTFDVDGIRHIVEPSVNYVYVPTPRTSPGQLPQFDYELPTLRLLPIDYPDYNAIDSVDSQNVIRFGLRNRFQTKRDGQIEDFLKWELFTDWRLRPRGNQQTYADLYSDLSFRPRSWIRLESQTRYDLNHNRSRMLLHTLTLEPNDTWSWTVGHFYLRDDDSTSPLSLGEGNNLITSTVFYRLNHNWGFRAGHHFDARDGRMQEQFYTVYRDLRSWTAAITGSLRDNGIGPKDYSIAFTFSLKAMPKFGVGHDTVRPHALLGS